MNWVDIKKHTAYVLREVSHLLLPSLIVYDVSNYVISPVFHMDHSVEFLQAVIITGAVRIYQYESKR